MRILTWNVGKKLNALNLGLTYLSRLSSSEAVLACFQELPAPAAPSLDSAALAAQGLAATMPLASNKLLFVHSRSVSCVNLWSEANDRLQIGQWRLASGEEFFVVGLHAIDRRNYPVAEVRGAYAALTRRALDERWRSGAPLALLGDFNAWPELAEIADRACFFCVSTTYDQQNRHLTFFGRTSPPLFRVEPAPGPRGTYFDKDTSQWRDVDHIYVSHQLRPQAWARRLDNISQRPLVTRNGRPSSKFSDHLPVEAHLALT